MGTLSLPMLVCHLLHPPLCKPCALSPRIPRFPIPDPGKPRPAPPPPRCPSVPPRWVGVELLPQHLHSATQRIQPERSALSIRGGSCPPTLPSRLQQRGMRGRRAAIHAVLRTSMVRLSPPPPLLMLRCTSDTPPSPPPLTPRPSPPPPPHPLPRAHEEEVPELLHIRLPSPPPPHPPPAGPPRTGAPPG